MSSRGALHAFHHQIGYAYRRLKQGSPVLAATLQPAIQAVQVGIATGGHRLSVGGHAKWPPWRNRVSHPQVQIATPMQDVAPKAHVWSKITSKTLRQHDSNETGIPGDGDDEVVSLTETWAESIDTRQDAPGRLKTHSRKSRRGRRAKTSAHLEMMVRAQSSAWQSANTEGNVPMALLGTLIECMEEDLQCDACEGSDGEQQLANSFSDRVDEGAQDPELEELPVPARIEEFEVRMHRKTYTSLGMAVNVLKDGLLVSWCSDAEDCLVGIWNAMGAEAVQLRAGDKITSCNGISDPEQILGCVSSGLGALRMQVRRGPFAQTELPVPAAGPPDWRDDADRESDDADVAQKKEEELEAKREAGRREYEEKKEEDAKVLLSPDKGDLQKLIAERLARSRGS